MNFRCVRYSARHALRCSDAAGKGRRCRGSTNCSDVAGKNMRCFGSGLKNMSLHGKIRRMSCCPLKGRSNCGKDLMNSFLKSRKNSCGKNRRHKIHRSLRELTSKMMNGHRHHHNRHRVNRHRRHEAERIQESRLAPLPGPRPQKNR